MSTACNGPVLVHCDPFGSNSPGFGFMRPPWSRGLEARATLSSPVYRRLLPPRPRLPMSVEL